MAALAAGCGHGGPTGSEDSGALDDAHGGGADDAGLELDPPGLPHIHNYSGAPAERVVALVERAIDGLGFDPASGEGPNPGDRFFAGRRYLAWIDQTGFAGKMNGLWLLDGAAGDELDFSLADPDGRPVNFFIPGEDGDGRWAGGYKGAEHIEFPSGVPEPGDPTGCDGEVCNWYGVNEAPPIRNPKIPWWSSCNPGSPDFADANEPLTVEELPDRAGLKLVYEAPLVKQADGDGTYDGDACHADELFPDGVRRPVFLRLGYELLADGDHFDRTMQIRNPAGNPSFTGTMSLIGGFVMTAWPDAHYLKRLHRTWRPESADVALDWDGQEVTLAAGSWNDLSSMSPSTRDVLVAWIDQPITLSATDGYAEGRSATLSHVGPSDNRDVGACLCAVHGAIEMGGGLLHGGISLPIDGGATTIEARRRLTLPSAVAAPRPTGRVYSMSGDLSHAIGRADGDGWSASTADDQAGALVYGPYATDWGGGSAQAVFALQIDDVGADDRVVATIEINDATADRVLAARELRRRDFRRPLESERFALDADLAGRDGHRMEARLWWKDVAFLRVESLAVQTSEY